MKELLRNKQYLLLGLFLSGGMAMAVGGSRMLQSTLVTIYTGNVSMPRSVQFILFGGILFGLSAGYLMRDMQAEYWNEVET